MKIIEEGLVFTSGERVVLAMACSWEGLRSMKTRSGFWSRRNLHGFPKSMEETAYRLLLRFGDLKMGPKQISRACAWAMNEVESEVFVFRR